MRYIISILIFIAVVLAVLPVLTAKTDAIAPFSFISSNAPRDIRELYLRFHDRDLCREVDVLFLYDESGLKVWCLVQDRGSYSKLLKMLRQLSVSYPIETYSSRLFSGNESDEKDTLPPSLWESNELRENLLNPSLRFRQNDNSDMLFSMLSPMTMYRQRLRLFSEETLKRGRELEHYGTELPELTQMAMDQFLDRDLRSLAVQVSIDHCKEMEKLIGKLENNLKYALPDNDTDIESEIPVSFKDSASGIQELAVQISEKSRNISRRVYAFIYPEQHTVKLNELRHPDILISMEVLRKMEKEYIKRMERISLED